MDESHERNRILAREIRRGLTTCQDAIFAWARGEPDESRKEFARTIGKALTLITKGLSVLNRDGMIVPGDTRRLPSPTTRPPHHFTD